MTLAPEGTHLRYVQDLVADAYAAMDPDSGSNDAEHEVLYAFVELAEDEIRSMGGDLPPHPGDEDDCMDNKITVIEAEHYEDARQRLMRDPIIIEMAKGLEDVAMEKMESGGTPLHEFMLAANREYDKRGGKEPNLHLGAVPEALLRLVKAERGEV